MIDECHSGGGEGADKWHQLSFPIVMFATIFFKTVFLFVYFLSLLSAASNSARNSCRFASTNQQRHEGEEYGATDLNLSPLEEFSILALRHGSLLRCGWGQNLDDERQSLNCSRSEFRGRQQ